MLPTRHQWMLLFLLLWLGLFRSHPATGKSYFLEAPDEKQKVALATLIDGEKMWIGYAGVGLAQYDAYGQFQRLWTVKDGLPGNTVLALVKREKELWIGTADGLAVIGAADGVKTFTVREGLPDNGITCLTVRDSDLFAGTLKGVVRFRGDTFDIINEEKGLPAGHITALAACPDGVIIGTPKGWAVLKGNQVEPHLPETDGLPFEWITSAAFFKYRKAILSAQSNVSDEWIVLGTAGGGLLFYHDKAYTVLRAEDAGPGCDWINCLLYDKDTNTLWVGTQTGLAVEKIEDGTWQLFNQSNGSLPADFVKAVSVHTNTEVYLDYEILLGKGRCPGDKMQNYLASHTREAVATRLAGATGSSSATVIPQDANSSSSAAASATLSASGTANASGPPCLCHPPRGKIPCPLCYQLPEVREPKKLHIYNTWAAVGTMDGAALLHVKELPHYGQGHIYSYLANKGWEVKGVGAGRYVFAGVFPPGAGEGFLFYFAPSRIAFLPGWANPPEVTFTSVINTLSTTIEGFPMVGAYSIGRGGLGILDLEQEESSLKNPWRIYGSKEGLKDLNVTCIFREGTTILVGTGLLGKSGSVFRFRNGLFESFPKAGLQHASLDSMFRAPVTCLWGNENEVYVGTKDDGIYHFTGDSWTRIHTFSNKILSDDRIQTLTYRDGILYVGTIKGLDCLWDGGGVHIDVTQWDCITNDVQYLLWDDSDSDGDQMVLWLGCKDGFSRISQTPGAMRHGGRGRSIGEGIMPWPGNPPYPAQVVIHSWVGNPQEGMPDICPFDGLPGNKIHMMAYDDINLWIGTDNGLCRFRK
jgi:ligand-binding sensor domain-containing protein